jgi:hypothetical protein
MTETDILELGFMLEEKGLTHEQIDAYFEHHGTKGMKWGVRRRGRVDRLTRVGKGKGSGLDKVRTYAKSNPIDLVKTGSFRKAQARKGARFVRRNERMATGKAKVFKDIIPSIGATRFTDLLPSTRSKKLSADQKSNLKKMNNGTEFLLAATGAAVSVALASNVAAKRMR